MWSTVWETSVFSYTEDSVWELSILNAYFKFNASAKNDLLSRTICNIIGGTKFGNPVSLQLHLSSSGYHLAEGLQNSSPEHFCQNYESLLREFLQSVFEEQRIPGELSEGRFRHCFLIGRTINFRRYSIYAGLLRVCSDPLVSTFNYIQFKTREGKDLRELLELVVISIHFHVACLSFLFQVAPR